MSMSGKSEAADLSVSTKLKPISRSAAQMESPALSRRSALLLLQSLMLLRAPSAARADVIWEDSIPAGAALTKALGKVITKPKAPVMLRLVFHDAGTHSAQDGSGGANASIRFELERPENAGLKRGWRVIEQVKESLKGTPAESVSYADIIAVAGAYAVQLCGGPRIPVQLGRVDATGPDPEGRLPAETSTAAVLKANFADKGLDTRDLVALSGAHTLGSKGFGDASTFDNAYYTALLAKPWLDKKNEMADMIGLPSDHFLPDDEECLRYIRQYAADQALWHGDFMASYLKMTSLGAGFA